MTARIFPYQNDTPLTDQQTVVYLADHYGACRRQKAGDECRCVGPGKRWLGRFCPHWEPLGATTFADLGLNIEERRAS